VAKEGLLDPAVSLDGLWKTEKGSLVCVEETEPDDDGYVRVKVILVSGYIYTGTMSLSPVLPSNNKIRRLTVRLTRLRTSRHEKAVFGTVLSYNMSVEEVRAKGIWVDTIRSVSCSLIPGVPP